MKLFALFALFAVAAADVCNDEDSDFGSVDGVIATVKGFLDPFTSECSNAAGESLATMFFNNDNCRALFDAGYCYGNVAMARYSGHNKDTVSWEQVAAGIDNARFVGTTACDNVEACFTPMKAAAIECWKNPAFQTQMRDNADMIFVTASTAAAAYADEHPRDIATSLINMALSNFESVDDIVAAVTSNLEEIQDAYESAVETASEFCDSGCVDQTADFLDGLLDSLTSSKKCKKVTEFCGKCQKVAALHFAVNAPPCCLTDIVDDALEEFDARRAEIGAYVDTVKSEVHGKGKNSIKAFQRQTACARNVYDERESGCAGTA